MDNKTNIKVDFSKREGIPLFKKFALFNSGIAPIKNYKRDMYTLDGVYVESLRADLFFGNKEHPMGLTVTGTQDDVKYDFSVLDEWMDILVGPRDSAIYELVLHTYTASGGRQLEEGTQQS